MAHIEGSVMSEKTHCVECRLSFGLVDRSEPAPNTCTDCAAKMTPSIFGECEQCCRMLQVGDRMHLEWVKLCRRCAKRPRLQSDRKLRTEKIPAYHRLEEAIH